MPTGGNGGVAETGNEKETVKSVITIVAITIASFVSGTDPILEASCV